MKPETETLILVIGSLLGFFLIPIMLIVLHIYLLAILFIGLMISTIGLAIYYGYIELLPIVRKKYLHDQELEDRFHSDPNKIKFYKGFMKFFAGSLDQKGLQHWFENHPTKIKK
jgi:hypothetical protein